MTDVDLPAQAAADGSAGDAGPVYESRVTLTPRNPRALLSILGRDMRRSDTQFAHRMIWTLFADAPEERRAGLFLFHVERNRPFTAIVRSRRPPVDGLGDVWTIEGPRPFAPILAPGQRLSFRLRAVASRWQPRPGARRGRRQDVMVAAWMALPEEKRTPEDLEKAAVEAALDWLNRRGRRCGFALNAGEVAVLDYDRTRLSPGRDVPDIRFGALTYEGRLTVTDVDAFRRMLVEGLGAARAYGNGLMQIAPAR